MDDKNTIKQAGRRVVAPGSQLIGRRDAQLRGEDNRLTNTKSFFQKQYNNIKKNVKNVKNQFDKTDL